MKKEPVAGSACAEPARPAPAAPGLGRFVWGLKRVGPRQPRPSNLRERGRRILIKKLNSNKYRGGGHKSPFLVVCERSPDRYCPVSMGTFCSDFRSRWSGWDEALSGLFRRTEQSRLGKQGKTVRYQSILYYLFFKKRWLLLIPEEPWPLAGHN